MKQAFAAELEQLVQNITPTESGFVLRGKTYLTDAAAPDKNNAMTSLMTQVLYNECYARKLKYQYDDQAAAPLWSDNGQGDFITHLSACNQSTALTDPGWTVSNILPGGYIQVSKYGVNRMMHIPDGHVPVLNEQIVYAGNREDRAVQKGFYYVYSDTPFEFVPTVVRMYWNIEPAGVGALIERLTARFNYYQLPFLFKCLSDPAQYTRRDGCVLYLRHKYMTQALELLHDINRDIGNYLDEDVPLFTYRVHNGFGVAESPADGNSFGLSRMELVAKGLLTAFGSGKKIPLDGLVQVNNAFKAAGIHPEIPFIEAGSSPRLFTNS